jgi:hypothetical protein
VHYVLLPVGVEPVDEVPWTLANASSMDEPEQKQSKSSAAKPHFSLGLGWQQW